MITETQLPKGWKKTTLGAEFEWSSGGTPKSGTPAYYENGTIHWLNISDLNDGLISCAEKQITELGLKESSAKIVPKNSVLIAIYGSIGKLGINTIPLATNQAICFTKKIPEYISNKFLFYYLLSIRNQLISMGKGGTQQNISQTVLKAVPFFYPTNKETQQAIVNKIESLFAEIDAGIASLKTAQKQLKQYRQSLLKNAFNGELTKQWRLENADRLPSANELLAQIQAAREQHHAQQLADWKAAVQQWEQAGKQGKKPSKPKAPTQAVKFEENFSSYYPYIRIPVGFFIEPAKYGTSQKCEYEKYENSTGVIRIPNITENGLIDLEDMKYAKFSTEEKEDYALKEGDLLLIRSNGSVNIVGSVGLVGKEETNYIYAGYLIRLRPIQSIVNSKFLTFAFQCLDTRTQIEFKAKSTSGVNNINAQEVQDLQINSAHDKKTKKSVKAMA